MSNFMNIAMMVAIFLLIAFLLIQFENWRYSGRKRKPRRATGDGLRPGQFRRPTICYVIESINKPGLVKVGFSRRSGEIRRREMEKLHGKRLRLLYEVRMPWACEVEGRIHDRLRRIAWRFPWHYGLGGEWYRPPGGARQLIAMVESAAHEVEQDARRMGSWGERQFARSVRY